MDGSRNTASRRARNKFGETMSNDPICNKSRVGIVMLADFYLRKLIDSTFVSVAP